MKLKYKNIVIFKGIKKNKSQKNTSFKFENINDVNNINLFFYVYYMKLKNLKFFYITNYNFFKFINK
jgi:hypothetical protein